ncbi:thiamine pyrophosphate-binding protein [Aeromicrobium piscarium]|uniref:Thiamine pyrophosphate-binding protein n=1 Tax=Aeromicrobium piscarium TaxID=2590901 RepID=A0A554RID4_9ACTN|nr:thiamine pyrophosphate-binding protein [Aeromicrobium piscarium]TSD53772.1 thiamine pyrophosphate-binding protein [Aeromicrobium piscarium]
MRIYEGLVRALRSAGADTVFGLMGDGNLDHVVTFSAAGGRFVPVLHEGGAVSMADGWSRTTGTIGVASVTHGPGFTNTLTALTEAARAHSRVLLLTGDTPEGSEHLQRFDLRSATELTGARYVRVTEEGAADQIAGALDQVRTGPGPVVLDVPLAVGGRELRGSVASALPDRGIDGTVLDEDALDAAVGALASSRRPVVLAGRGAVLSEARGSLLDLAARIGAPVATSLLAREYFAGDVRDLGIAGTLSDPSTLDLLLRSDCIVSFGASLNRFTMAEGALASGRGIVQVDLDKDAFGRHVRPDAVVQGDAAGVARAMVELLAEAGIQREDWHAGVPAPSAAAPPVAARGTVDAGAALDLLNRLLPAERLVVTDTGRFVYTAWRRLGVAHPSSFVHTLNFASIGLGVATGIGASAAHPDRLTVVVAGDGGGMMGLGELTTAVRERLPLLIVIVDDGSYGMEHHALRQAGLDTDYARTSWPSFADVARGYGAEAHTITDLDQLRDVLEHLPAVPAGPVLIDLVVDPEAMVAE